MIEMLGFVGAARMCAGLSFSSFGFLKLCLLISSRRVLNDTMNVIVNVTIRCDALDH